MDAKLNGIYLVKDMYITIDGKAYQVKGFSRDCIGGMNYTLVYQAPYTQGAERVQEKMEISAERLKGLLCMDIYGFISEWR